MKYHGFDLDERIYKDSRTNKNSLLIDSEYKGFRYFITTMCRFPCAYIVLENDTDIELDDLEVNGGVSYRDYTDHWAVGELHKPIIGWDYGHCWNTQYEPYLNSLGVDSWDPYEHPVTLEEVENDVRKAIDQILKMPPSPKTLCKRIKKAYDQIYQINWNESNHDLWDKVLCILEKECPEVREDQCENIE